MSLFGSLTTAITGLNAQSRALGHISDNVANSQTIGFKRVDTNFVSYLTQSSNSAHSPVDRRDVSPVYRRSVGSLPQSVRCTSRVARSIRNDLASGRFARRRLRMPKP